MMRTSRCRLAVFALVLGIAAAMSTDDQALAANADHAIYTERGKASFYGPGFHGKLTASGERFNQYDLTAAHPDLPLGTQVTVTNLENGKTVEVQVNDRGPYKYGRVIDLSTAAAARIGITIQNGIAPVKIEATAAQMAEGEADDGRSMRGRRIQVANR